MWPEPTRASVTPTLASAFIDELEWLCKHADLVILEANLLDNIPNTRKMYAVVIRGKLLSRASLAALLAEVETLAPNR